MADVPVHGTVNLGSRGYRGFASRLRARLVATSNLRFDPDYEGLSQTSILFLSGMSGCHKNSITKM